MQICAAPTTECILCGRDSRKLVNVPNKIRDSYYLKNNIIIKHGSRICMDCKCNFVELSSPLPLTKYFATKLEEYHNQLLTQNWFDRTRNQLLNGQCTAYRNQHLIIQQQRQINVLKKQISPNTKNKRRTMIKYMLVTNTEIAFKRNQQNGQTMLTILQRLSQLSCVFWI